MLLFSRTRLRPQRASVVITRDSGVYIFFLLSPSCERPSCAATFRVVNISRVVNERLTKIVHKNIIYEYTPARRMLQSVRNAVLCEQTDVINTTQHECILTMITPDSNSIILT